MIPAINKPTRVTRATVIDHVFTNTIMENIEIKIAAVKTYFQPFSYHLATKTN